MADDCADCCSADCISADCCCCGSDGCGCAELFCCNLLDFVLECVSLLCGGEDCTYCNCCAEAAGTRQGRKEAVGRAAEDEEEAVEEVVRTQPPGQDYLPRSDADLVFGSDPVPHVGRRAEAPPDYETPPPAYSSLTSSTTFHGHNSVTLV